MTIQKNNYPAASPFAEANDLKPGLVLCQAEYDLFPLKNPARRYLILSSQRTGSNYLCRRLCNLRGSFGLPSEYLHPKAIQMLSARLLADAVQEGRIPIAQYMKEVERARTTTDGWFGIKVQPSQLLAVVGRKEQEVQRFVASFDRLVLMTRRDKLGQAVSGAIAQVTGKWFNDGEEPALDDTRISSLFPAIAHNLSRYIDEERMILNIGRVVAKPLLRIEYEEIEADDQAAFMNLVDFLAGGETLALDEEDSAAIPEKPPGDFARAVRECFLRFIAGHRCGK
jgi:LPS sulfotransferase NodH